MSYDRWNARTCNIPEALLTFGIKTEIRKAKPYVKLNKADIITIWPLENPRKNKLGYVLGLGVLL